MSGYRAAFARKRCLPVFVPVSVAVASAVVLVSFGLASSTVWKHVRIRRHLHRLRNLPLE